MSERIRSVALPFFMPRSSMCQSLMYESYIYETLVCHARLAVGTGPGARSAVCSRNANAQHDWWPVRTFRSQTQGLDERRLHPRGHQGPHRTPRASAPPMARRTATNVTTPQASMATMTPAMIRTG